MATEKKQLERPYSPGGMKEMIALALPMVVSFACDMVMTFTDRLFLSKLGPEHMSAAMAGGLSSFMMMSFFLGLVGYTTALAAQYFGAQKKDQCSRVVTQALIVVLFSYPILILLRPLAHMLFDHSNLDPYQLELQISYFDILMYGSAVVLGRHVLSCYFSGIGKTHVVMLGAFTAMTVNCIANYGLIYGNFGLPALGIKGAAIGTIIGGLSGFGVLLYFYLRKDNAGNFFVRMSFVFDKKIMGQLCRLGYPAGIEMTLNIVAFTLIVMMFHGQGIVPATATTVVFNWDMVTFVPLLGFEIGVTSLVGRYIGAGKPEIARKAVLSGLKLGLIYSFLIMLLFIIFPHFLVGIFRPDVDNEIFSDALPLAVSMIKLIPFYISAVAVMIVYVGALRGAGDTFGAMVMTTAIHWFITFTVYAAIHKFGFSALSAWVTLVVAFLAVCWLPYLRYRQEKWKNIHIVGSAEKEVV